jgi:4'-phosphopantetheinyl transferase
MSFSEILWLTPPSRWPLYGREIHVWAANLRVSVEKLAGFESTLSMDEEKRAGRFHFEPDRNDFVAGRGILRAILGSYLEMEPSKVQFEYGAFGKPILANQSANSRLHFNLAHSDGLFLTAVSRLCPVGVDLERIRVIADPDDLVKQLLSKSEAVDWQALPNSVKRAVFYNLWTRKEACLKATGEGITERLQEFAVSFMPDEPARVVKSPQMSPSTGAWTVKELHPGPGYTAALAVPDSEFNLSCWQWPL